MYKLVSTNAYSRYNIGVYISMKMILSHTYNPEQGIFFALKLPAVENQLEIILEILPDRLTYRDSKTDTAPSIQEVENILLQRRINRNSSEIVFK